MLDWLVVLTIGVGAGTLGGVVGFGSSVIMVPLLAFFFGPKAAIPIMAIASLMANLSRVAIWWRTIDWRAVFTYSITAIPCAALGARTLLALEPRAVELALGVFLVATVPMRRVLGKQGFTIARWHLAIVGAVIGFLTGIVASTGPVNAPFFLAYGLVKGAYLSTEALSSAFVYFTKSVVFWEGGALPLDMLLRGLIVGSSLMVGSWLAKRLVERMTPGDFRFVMDILLLLAGGAMILQALAD